MFKVHKLCITFNILQFFNVNTGPISISKELEKTIDFNYQDYQLYTVSGVTYYLDNVDDIIKNRLRANITWEPDTKKLIEKLKLKGTVVLDIGAHIGTHSITLSQMVGSQGAVHSFEPQEKIFRELCMNLIINDCNNVIVHKCAVGSEIKKVYLGEPIRDNEGGRYLNADGSEEVDMITIDSLNLSNISFIKIDVENTEEYVLEGCRETIKKNKPTILIEVRGNKTKAAKDGENMCKAVTMVLEKIRSYGYQVKHFKLDDYLARPL